MQHNYQLTQYLNELNYVYVLDRQVLDRGGGP